MIETSTVFGVIAAARVFGSTKPAPSTGRTVSIEFHGECTRLLAKKSSEGDLDFRKNFGSKDIRDLVDGRLAGFKRADNNLLNIGVDEPHFPHDHGLVRIRFNHHEFILR